MTKQQRKEIMVRFKLRNEFKKSRTSENWEKNTNTKETNVSPF